MGYDKVYAFYFEDAGEPWESLELGREGHDQIYTAGSRLVFSS